MLTIEKVILLKSVGMFANSSEEALAEVASILEELEFQPGETVFEKGDQGHSMYVIIEGRVRVLDGDRTINVLGERDIFGELALLDPEPRSASVVAIEETRCFRLDRDSFYELMSANVEMMQGIVQVLCQRLRRMTAMAVARPPGGAS
jgi:CRP-like cAMP-binding protein